ncbi:ribonuclease P protein component [Phycicoccus sp. Soil802]|uniref:ribonuclease P protein component n=1 Tax=Phycicoccus sp. Soil802 TaxID=1736414 RepID=UPI0007032E4A|nr:ribonuclease P protein component [Phycicoccus sp. Soil802]KRF28832.1 ribonuclease P protein component [Phycicoccus sp. Soil802]
MLPAGHRLRASSDFAATFRGPRGARAGSTLIVVHANQADARAGQPPRVGFVVSKAVGNAVVRNRTKRRLRALMAARLSAVPAGTDLVIRANPVAAQANSASLAIELDTLLARVSALLGATRA